MSLMDEENCSTSFQTHWNSLDTKVQLECKGFGDPDFIQERLKNRAEGEREGKKSEEKKKRSGM